MGTTAHHQTRSQAFLQRADQSLANRDPTAAAQALGRAASHVITALAVHWRRQHNTQRRLETTIHQGVHDGCLSRSHLKTFRQTHTLPRHLTATNPTPAVTPTRPPAGSPTPAVPPPRPPLPASAPLRRMRRRVAALIKAGIAILAGQPQPIRHHQRRLRQPNRTLTPTFATVQDILNLPNYAQIQAQHHLTNTPLAARPDPHGWYEKGHTPPPCSCHPETRGLPNDEPILTLSPLWRQALNQTFRLNLPPTLKLTF